MRQLASTAPAVAAADRVLLTPRVLWTLLAAVLLLRLASLGLYPLMDTSEARYAEMARKMLAFDNWVTPLFDVGVPFWGKPPLAFWTQALSMKWLGVSEFAVRLPSWLFHVGSSLIVLRFGREERDTSTGLLAAIIFSSCSLGLVAAGVVLTDPALCFAVVLASYGFWRGMVYRHTGWALAGFAGLGLGLLAKGPLVGVLVGAPALFWTLYNRQWRRLLQLPWLRGIALMTLIAVPWYLAAEQRTPGFLDYFLVGEHWKRYVVTGWAGDLYGTAHARAPGSIWPQLLVALFPWSMLVPLLFFGQRRNAPPRPYRSFLLAWALAAPLFFTFSANILWTYALPALPALSLLLADVLRPRVAAAGRVGWASTFTALALLMPVALLAALWEGRVLERPNNQKPLVQTWAELQKDAPGRLYYLGKRSYSGEFYSGGKARRLADACARPPGRNFYVVMRGRRGEPIEAWPGARDCQPRLQRNNSLLLQCMAMPLAATVSDESAAQAACAADRPG